jgi:hypothetical protein
MPFTRIVVAVTFAAAGAAALGIVATRTSDAHPAQDPKKCHTCCKVRAEQGHDFGQCMQSCIHAEADICTPLPPEFPPAF